MYAWTLKLVSSKQYLQGDAVHQAGERGRAESPGKLYCLSANGRTLDFLRQGQNYPSTSMGSSGARSLWKGAQETPSLQHLQLKLQESQKSQGTSCISIPASQTGQRKSR